MDPTETNTKIETGEHDKALTPWAVSGIVNYMAQINRFGTNAIDGALIQRWERVTKMKAHTWLRRGIVFSHQDIDSILNCVEQGIPIFLYTGRGPSSESMHMGHMVPFKFTKYLQDALNCIVVIQMSDDEKFLFKDGNRDVDLKKFNELTYKNAKDIIACGFDKNKTYIFSNLETNGGDLYFNNILIAKATTMNTIKATYGIGETVDEAVLKVVKEALEKELKKEEPDQESIRSFEKLLKNNGNKESNSIGQCMWPVFQCGPAFATSFKSLFIRAITNALKTKNMPDMVHKNMKKALKELSTIGKTQSMMCLVPMAIDQAPYFRMARDVAHTLGHPKPAVIHSEFLPGLHQAHGKMSSTANDTATLFLDMDEKIIRNVIKKHAFSGGKTTLNEHKMYGGNISIDISYQYLTYFLDDDNELKQIAEKYSAGDMTSGDLKNITANKIAEVITEHQHNKAAITDDDLAEFFNPSRVLDIGGCYDRDFNGVDNTDTDYSNMGINFDRTFGFKPKQPW